MGSHGNGRGLTSPDVDHRVQQPLSFFVATLGGLDERLLNVDHRLAGDHELVGVQLYGVGEELIARV